MQFELTEALIDQILFAMEDQQTLHVLDTSSGVVIDSSSGDGSETSGTDAGAERDDMARYIPLPEWIPADGFRLMERFAASLRNPIVREELVAALDRGRGVFRAFKDVLSHRPEVERLWFSFKEREMRRGILEWYNALREEWGLERIGDEPEDTEDLVLEDFRFRAGSAADSDDVRALLVSCGDDGRLGDGPLDLNSSEVSSILAVTARDELAGIVLVERSGRAARLDILDVHPDYRGLGVGEELLDRALTALESAGVEDVLLDLPESSSSFSRVLYRHGFSVYETRFALNLRGRRLEGR